MVTTAAAPQGTIELPPCVPKKSKLLTENTHPDRVMIEVTERVDGVVGDAFNFYVHPEWQHPEEAKLSQPSHSVACEHRQWTW